MARAHLAGQGGDGAGSFPTVFAGVFRGFVAFIESVSALADSVGMTRACGAGQRLDARISVPAVFAVKLRHDERFLFVVIVVFGELRPQSGLSDDLLFFPGGWWAFPVEAAQRPPVVLGLPCLVNCNGSAGSGNKSAERWDQRTRAELVTVCPVRHSKSVCAVPFNRASRWSSLSCRVDVPGKPGRPPLPHRPAALFTRFRSRIRTDTQV